MARTRKRRAAPKGKPDPAQFTRDDPVTKLELWNCFRGKTKFVRRQVAEAEAIIGKNAPRYLIRKKYAERTSTESTDYYVLTEAGEQWLYEGFKRYLKNHPEDVQHANNLPAMLQ